MGRSSIEDGLTFKELDELVSAAGKAVGDILETSEQFIQETLAWVLDAGVSLAGATPAVVPEDNREVKANVGIGVVAAIVSPIECGCRGRTRCDDQNKPLQVVMMLMVPGARPEVLVPTRRLTMQRVACRKNMWSYLIDMDGRFLRPGRMPSSLSFQTLAPKCRNSQAYDREKLLPGRRRDRNKQRVAFGCFWVIMSGGLDRRKK